MRRVIAPHFLALPDVHKFRHTRAGLQITCISDRFMLGQ